ncbi:cytidine deaminase [Maribacter sp. HTCC2170]|uniref:cytidine deaminase n=1 Tax=Maribacter sp. (strain HTCC2170 / KCCM 42371) TaxID=313603 RepID=UPI00006B1AA0|nr:cytidine deaminase [Maribacter sp. HTCC2170]EAR00877.1 cytidine deaminase [Maribacter sp. HTCC2170]
MKKKTISFELSVYETLGALNEQDRDLMHMAIEARKDAYAPYSNFMVGAAVLLANGKTVIGSNQENASYPSGLCAERVAVFQAGAKYPGVTIKSIAITAMSKTHLVEKPAAPCGNCRQAISEYEFKQKSPIELLLMAEKGEIIKCQSLADILPLGFNSSYL